MTNDTRKALVEIGLKMARSARDGGCDTHGHAIELFTEQVERDGDCIKALEAENERLREALEYIQPFLEDYLDVALENGHPELIGHATLAVKEVAAALGDTK